MGAATPIYGGEMIYTTAKFLLSRLKVDDLLKLMRDIEIEIMNRAWLGWCLGKKKIKEGKNEKES